MNKTAGLILIVVSIAFLAPVWAAETAQPGVTSKKYPPYPDVWQSKGRGKLCKSDNGDFYLVSDPLGGEGNVQWKLTALFGQSVIELSPREGDAVLHERKPLAGVGTLSCYDINDYPPSLILRNGFIVRRTCLHSLGLCDYPYYSGGLEIRDKDQRIVARGALLGLLKIPIKQHLPYPKVAEDVDGEIAERVQSLQPRLVPLEDETFLVHTLGGVVFRFDTKLRTRFPINKDQLFMIEPSLIEAIYTQATRSSKPGSLAWHQALQDAAAEMLVKLKKEK